MSEDKCKRSLFVGMLNLETAFGLGGKKLGDFAGNSNSWEIQYFGDFFFFYIA